MSNGYPLSARMPAEDGVQRRLDQRESLPSPSRLFEESVVSPPARLRNGVAGRIVTPPDAGQACFFEGPVAVTFASERSEGSGTTVLMRRTEIPVEKITREHVVSLIGFTDVRRDYYELAVVSRTEELEQKKKDVRAFATSQLKLVMVETALSKGMMVGDRLVQSFADLKASIKYDNSAQNADIVYDITFGHFDRNPKWEILLEERYMVLRNIAYMEDLNESAVAGTAIRRKKGCIAKLLSNVKSELVKQIQRHGAKASHASYVTISRKREEITPENRFWKRKKGAPSGLYRVVVLDKPLGRQLPRLLRQVEEDEDVMANNPFDNLDEAVPEEAEFMEHREALALLMREENHAIGETTSQRGQQLAMKETTTLQETSQEATILDQQELERQRPLGEATQLDEQQRVIQEQQALVDSTRHQQEQQQALEELAQQQEHELALEATIRQQQQLRELEEATEQKERQRIHLVEMLRQQEHEQDVAIQQQEHVRAMDAGTRQLEHQRELEVTICRQQQQRMPLEEERQRTEQRALDETIQQQQKIHEALEGTILWQQKQQQALAAAILRQ